MSWRVFVTDGSDPGPIAAELTARSLSHRIAGPADLVGSVAAEVAAGYTRIAVTGGDPQLAAAMEGVIESGAVGRVDLALLPGRTRSDLARTFAFDQGLAAAVDRMAVGTPYPIDAGVVEGAFGRIVFANSVASGILAGGPRWFPAWPRPLRAAGPVVVRAGTTIVESIASGILILNGQFWGDWVGAPRSTLVDGVVDLQVFSGRRRMLARLRPAFRTGMHVRGTGVRRLAVAQAEIEQPARWQVVVDGIPVGHGSFSVTVVPGVVRLAV